MRTIAFALLCSPVFAAEPMICVNLDPATVPELVAGATAAGLVPATGDLSQLSRVMLVQADAGGKRIDAAVATRLEAHLRAGGALLLTLSQKPGNDAFRCSPFLPTTAWQTLLPDCHRGGVSDPVRFGTSDQGFFPAAPQGALAWHWRLKPLHAAERGEQRYEYMARTQAHLNLPMAAGEGFLSRSLLNRDWQVRLDADEVRHDGLLITGKYGAGRVAVFAADASQGDRALWSATLNWLAVARPAEVAIPDGCTPTVRIDVAGRRLVITARNPGTQALTLPVVARISGWDGTPIGDRLGELMLPAGAAGETAIPLPAPDAISACILAERDELRVRIAILAPDGSRAVSERTLGVDFRPTLRAELSADELRAHPRPFATPGPESLKLPSRGGTPVSMYAMKPGTAVGIDLVLHNGVANLAPQATVHDATTGATQDDVVALHDEASGRMTPRDSYKAWGAWHGIEKLDNVLEFTFPAAVTISAVVLNGDVSEAGKNSTNPGAALITCDNLAVLAVDDLDARFAAGRGLARIAFTAPVTGRMFRITLPWPKESRAVPTLGEIELWGWSGSRVSERTTKVELRLSTPGRSPISLLQQDTVVPGGASVALHVQATPPTTGVIGACSVEALIDGQVVATLPLLVTDPPHPMRAIADLMPKDQTIAFNAIVTRGFRTFFDLATGSRDTAGSWSSPEDLIFAYSRGLKQTGTRAHTHAGLLYLSEHDFRHYATAWSNLPSGDGFFTAGLANLSARIRNTDSWKRAEIVNYSFSDRWDTGPSVDNLWTWPEMVAFDRWLGTQGKPRLSGRTREALAQEILANQRSTFRGWQLARYVANITAMRTFAEQDGKRAVLTAQGVPLVPLSALPALADTIQGMSDDNTWGAMEEDLPRTAGRQMAILAFNPSWRMRSNFVWGWDNTVFNNSHWYAPVGTTETSRRHHVIRAFRSTIDLDGTYKSVFAFGYGMNGYAPFFTSREDWQENWNAAERGSLITADGPIGAGVIVSTGAFDDPTRTVFSGGGMGGSNEAEGISDGVARLIGLLHHAGVSVPFAANVTAAGHWHGRAPLVLADLSGFTSVERAQVATWAKEGVPLVVFTGGRPVADDLAGLFAGAIDNVVQVDGKPVVVVGNRILINASINQLDLPTARDLARLMHQVSGLDIVFPDGCAGHGFTMAGKRFITVEDWLEQGREVVVRLRASTRTATAISLNEHRVLAIRRDGDDWAITLPLRGGDGDLIMVEEQP